ncbi:hypothetical protein ACFL4G_11250 [Thermodesulfobacteriota bacterium]
MISKDQEKRKDKDTQDLQEPYDPPRIVTYSGEDLLNELGPAQSCTGFGCPVLP